MISQDIEKHGSWQDILNFWLVDYNVLKKMIDREIINTASYYFL